MRWAFMFAAPTWLFAAAVMFRQLIIARSDLSKELEVTHEISGLEKFATDNSSHEERIALLARSFRQTDLDGLASLSPKALDSLFKPFAVGWRESALPVLLDSNDQVCVLSKFAFALLSEEEADILHTNNRSPVALARVPGEAREKLQLFESAFVRIEDDIRTQEAITESVYFGLFRQAQTELGIDARTIRDVRRHMAIANRANLAINLDEIGDSRPTH